MKSITDDDLVSELWAWDVRFLMGESFTDTPILSPKIFLQLLAQSPEARIRLSLIPLLLRHPDFANEAEMVDNEILDPDAKLVFRFYYTASMLLQQMHKEILSRFLGNQMKIPDLFSKKLGINLPQNPHLAIINLSEHHKILSEQKINWLGTYQHATDVWLKQLKYSNIPLSERNNWRQHESHPKN
ncbi:MAG: hypothetical protein JNJ43_10810 [Anaerolineales bacterium]|nr:hypothetical protein [Anaerolineales bacterium]